MRQLTKQNDCQHEGGRQVLHLFLYRCIDKSMEREHDAILSTILQEEPDRDIFMENKGIVGEDYELMSEPNS